jgi:hypothetical protein
MSGIVGGRNNRGSGLIADLGTDGQILTSAGLGLRQVYEAAAAGGAWNIINTAVASGSSTVDITGLDSTYDTYCIMISDMVPADDGESIRFLCGDSSGIDSGSTDYAFHHARSTEAGTSYVGYASTGSANIILGTSAGNQAGEGWGFTIWLHRPGDGTTQPNFSWTGISITCGSVVTQHAGAGMRQAVIALDRVQVKASGGNIATGRMTVYGIAHA